MAEVTLAQAARFVRSKNAGPFELTYDIIFEDPRAYRALKASGVLTRDTVATVFNCLIEEVYDVVFYDPALGVKVTIRRPVPSGDPIDTDVYGAQQHAPLLAIRFPYEQLREHR